MATCLLKGVRLLTFLFFIFLNFFNLFFSFGYVLENQIICHFKWGLRLFKGLHLLFLRNVPRATFIQRSTFIPESRVKGYISINELSARYLFKK